MAEKREFIRVSLPKNVTHLQDMAKDRANELGFSLSGYIVNLIKKDLEFKGQTDRLEGIERQLLELNIRLGTTVQQPQATPIVPNPVKEQPKPKKRPMMKTLD